jgi:hypothetical protein
MLILYNVKITIVNTATNATVAFNKNFESDVNLDPVNLYNNYHILHDAIYVLDLFQQEIADYCTVENITSDLIEIDEYEIVSLTEKADVFFENPENANVFTLKPSIKCYIYPAEEPLPAPTLIGTAYDSTTIIWTWPDDMAYAHFLIEEPIDVTDENSANKIIAQLPIGKSSFIETGLQPNTSYSRRLVNYTSTQTSLPSPQISVTTETINPTLSVEQYNIERELDFSTTDQDKEIIEENLKAFHSGVGDYNDLKVYKQMDSDFYESFKAYVELSGKRIEREKRYDQVGFNYKVCLEATETIEEQEGEVTFKVDLYPKQKITVSQYIWATHTFTVIVKVGGWVRLYRGTGVSDDKLVYIESDGIPFVFDYNKTPVGYVENEERVTITPMGEVKLSNTSVYDLLHSKLLTNEYYTGAYGGIPYNKNVQLGHDYSFDNIVILDTYMYSDEDTITNQPDMTVFMEDDYSLMGTINVYTDKDVNDNYLATSSNYLYISGYTEAIIYEGTRFANAELNAYNNPQVTLFSSSETRYLLKSRLNRSVSFGGDMSNVRCITKHVEVGSYITVFGDGFVSDMIARIDAHFTSPTLDYRFNIEDPEAYTPYYEILPASNRESMDYNIVVLSIFYCQNVSVNGAYLNFNPSGVGAYQSQIVYVYPNEMIDEYVWFYAKPMTKTRPYYDELPGKDFDALYGLVNGRYRKDNESGKQDLKVDTPQFNIPTTVTKLHANTVKIYIKITEFYPDTALVGYQWDHELTPGSGMTQVNGDYVTFSCDSLTYKDIEYRDIIGTYELEGLELFDFKAKTIVYEIAKPSSLDKYTNFYLKIFTDNDDVLAARYPTEIIFNEQEDTVVVPIDFKGVVNSTSMWSPRIHNGHYYINQHERYLYSEFDVKADFDKQTETVYDTINGYAAFDVTMKKIGGPAEDYTILKDTSAEMLQDEQSFKWVPKVDDLSVYYGVTLKPIIAGLSYREYATKTYLSPVILFPNCLTTARALFVDYIATDGTSTGLKLFIRSYDLSKGAWTDWTEFVNGSVPAALSAAYQIKMDLSATVSNNEYYKDDYLSCYLDWKEEMHESVSNNIVTITDHMTTGPDDAEGIFISKIIDFSCLSGLQLSMYTSSSEVRGYVAFSNTQEDLVVEKITWLPMAASNLSMNYKYYRYKIVIPAGEKVYWVNKKYRTLATSETLPYVRSISMGRQYQPVDIISNFVNIESFVIPRDSLWHTVINRIGDYISSDVIQKGFALTEITKINIKATSPEIQLLFDINILNDNPDPALLEGSVDAATATEIMDVTKTSPYIFVHDGVVSIEGTPQQFSPISVEDEAGNAYMRIVSRQMSATNLIYTEVIHVAKGTKYVELKYNNYDPDTLSIWINDDMINSEDYQTKNQIILFNSEIETDSDITISYNILRSFYAEIDRTNNTTKLYLYSGTDIPMPAKVKVMFETNEKNNKMIASHISLNPVYRTDYSGFIYLTDDHSIPHTVKIYCNPKRIQSGGHDRVDVQVEILDILKNPVIGKEVMIDCKYGILIGDSFETDVNGVVHFVYESSWLPSNDTITVICTIDDFNQITESIEIINY